MFSVDDLSLTPTVHTGPQLKRSHDHDLSTNAASFRSSPRAYRETLSRAVCTVNKRDSRLTAHRPLKERTRRWLPLVFAKSTTACKKFPLSERRNKINRRRLNSYLERPSIASYFYFD